MKKLKKTARKQALNSFLKISVAESHDECMDIIKKLMSIIKDNGYDIDMEDLIIKKQKKVDPISGSPMSAYTLQNQLPTNGVPLTGDNYFSIDDNITSMSLGLTNVG